MAALQHTRKNAGIEFREVSNHGQSARVRIGRAIPRQAGALGGEPGPIGVASYELALAEPVDPLRGVNVVRQERSRRLECRGQLEDALHSLELGAEGLVLHQRLKLGANAVAEELVDAGPQQIELGMTVDNSDEGLGV